MTLVTRVPGTPDPSLPPVLPSFGRSDVVHMWHPRSYTSGDTIWRDEIGELPLNLSGTVGTAVTKDPETSGRPTLHTRSTGAFLNESVPQAEARTVVILAKLNAADAGGTPYLLQLGSVSLAQAVGGATTATTVPATSNITGVAMDVWHMYAVSMPASRLATFAVDGASRTLATAAGADNNVLRISATSSLRRESRLGMVLTLANALTPAELADLFIEVKTWFSDLTWGSAV
jgi:hypothetical protein